MGMIHFRKGGSRFNVYFSISIRSGFHVQLYSVRFPFNALISAFRIKMRNGNFPAGMKIGGFSALIQQNRFGENAGFSF